MGSSYLSRKDANKLDPTHRLLSDHNQANPHLNLSSSQARRSRAARFGSSRNTTYASPHLSAQEQDQDQQLALAYASPTGTSTSSIYLPEYVAWAISQLIAAANDPKLLRADHLKLAHLTDPHEHMAEAAHIPPKRSSLLHLATVSPHRYAAILAVLAEVRQRLSTSGAAHPELEEPLPRWTPEIVLDFDCAAGEGLWAAAHVFRQDASDPHSSTSVQRYHGYDRRPNLLKSGKKVAQSSASNVSPADPPKPERQVQLKDEGEEIQLDGVTYYEQESDDVQEAEPTAVEYFTGPKSAMASVEKTFQSVPLAKDLAAVGAGGRSLALSAFALSLMTNDNNRFEAVQAMWDSGAEVIVIIDQATPRGFASVASARAQLLQLGRADAAGGQGGGGAHVVAPCSHDKPCPLLHPFAISSAAASAVGARSDTGNGAKSKDICGFTARYHTPGFLRRTKHSDRGEENVGYSYVVVRRGVRPSFKGEAKRRLAVQGREEVGPEEVREIVDELAREAGTSRTGILDLLRGAKSKEAERRMLQEVQVDTQGQEAMQGDTCQAEMSDDQAMDELLQLLPDVVKAEFEAEANEPMTAEQLDSIIASIRSSITSPPPPSFPPTASASATPDDPSLAHPTDTAASDLAMRLESYTWPRLIRPPLKKGGHVTLDACCSTGNIERFTISRASGRQAYQDARKAKWGDLFPHPARSRSVVKVLNPLVAVEIERGEQQTDNVLHTLTLRAPTKLGNPNATLIAPYSDDQNSILNDLFLPSPTNPNPTINTHASYRLISPNLITPTPKQTKKIAINHSNKWNSSSSSSALAFESSPRQAHCPPPIVEKKEPWRLGCRIVRLEIPCRSYPDISVKNGILIFKAIKQQIVLGS